MPDIHKFFQKFIPSAKAAHGFAAIGLNPCVKNGENDIGSGIWLGHDPNNDVRAFGAPNPRPRSIHKADGVTGNAVKSKRCSHLGKERIGLVSKRSQR